MLTLSTPAMLTTVPRAVDDVNMIAAGDRDDARGYHHGNLKEALIRAALELIAQKGPAGFTFAEAARFAGVSPAAPYRHYRDRDVRRSHAGTLRHAISSPSSHWKLRFPPSRPASFPSSVWSA